eukprot:804278-Prorocentrum_minimum.AAC.2
MEVAEDAEYTLESPFKDGTLKHACFTILVDAGAKGSRIRVNERIRMCAGARHCQTDPGAEAGASGRGYTSEYYLFSAVVWCAFPRHSFRGESTGSLILYGCSLEGRGTSCYAQ